MKKFLLSFLAFAALLFIAASAPQSPFTVSTTTSASTSLTTQVQIARIQGDPAADGSLTLQVYTRKIVTASDGTVVSNTFNATSVAVPVTGQLLTDLTSAATTAINNASSNAGP